MMTILRMLAAAVVLCLFPYTPNALAGADGQLSPEVLAVAIQIDDATRSELSGTWVGTVRRNFGNGNEAWSTTITVTIPSSVTSDKTNVELGTGHSKKTRLRISEGRVVLKLPKRIDDPRVRRTFVLLHTADGSQLYAYYTNTWKGEFRGNVVLLTKQ